MIQDHVSTPFAILKEKYSINTQYFIVSNQFYDHKNHIVVLNAIKILKEKGINTFVYFSGKTEDYRNPKFFSSLVRKINTNKINSNLKILGLIPREDQLGLIKGSLAVIQPSKFEGWSTIIEDAKTLTASIICSSLEVHKEQLGNNGNYFNADSPEELADLMEKFIYNKTINPIIIDSFNNRASNFANQFLNIFN